MHHRHRSRRPSRRPRLRPAREIQTETASEAGLTGAQQRASLPAPTATPPGSPPPPTTGLPGPTGTWRLQLPTLSETGPPGPSHTCTWIWNPSRSPAATTATTAPATTPAPASATWWKDALRRMRLSALPPRRSPLRLRTHHCLGRRRRHMRVQCGASLPSSPPHQTAPGLASGPAPARHPHLDHPRGPHLHHRTDHLPRLTCALIPPWGKRGARVSQSLAVIWSPDSAGAKYQPAAISEMTVNEPR